MQECMNYVHRTVTVADTGDSVEGAAHMPMFNHMQAWITRASKVQEFNSGSQKKERPQLAAQKPSSTSPHASHYTGSEAAAAASTTMSSKPASAFSPKGQDAAGPYNREITRADNLWATVMIKHHPVRILYLATREPCPGCTNADKSKKEHCPNCYRSQCSKCSLYGHRSQECRQDE